MSLKWKVFWSVSLALIVFFQACGIHDWRELVISLEDEKQMGREFDSLVKIGHGDVLEPGESLFDPGSDPAKKALYEYYQERAKEIVNVIDSKDLEALLPSGYTKNNFFEFKIINSKQVNAFAVPGGYVYFYTPILKTFQSEAELAGVMAHEIGHVVLHHSRDRIVKQVGASVIIDALLGNGMGALLASLGTNVWLMQNSQSDEFQADSMGFYYTNKIGISSKGLSDFFARGLDTNAQGKCKNPDKESSVLDVFSTHPPSCERIEKNLDRIAKNAQNFPSDKNKPNGKSFTQLVSDAKL